MTLSLIWSTILNSNLYTKATLLVRHISELVGARHHDINITAALLNILVSHGDGNPYDGIMYRQTVQDKRVLYIALYTMFLVKMEF